MVYFLLVLFVTAVAGLRSHQSGDEGFKDAFHVVLNPYSDHHHGRDEQDHDGKSAHAVNVETLNVIVKNNKILPPDGLSKRIGRTKEKKPSRSLRSGDSQCKLGARCGCGGGKSARCGCRGRSGASCEHDHTLDNAIFLKPNPAYKAEEKKGLADPAIVKLLDDLEKSLLVQSNQHSDDESDHNEDNRQIDDNKKPDLKDPVGFFLNNLKKALDDSEINEKNTELRCCENCARSSFRSGDNRSYLRCCSKCNKNLSIRADNSDRERWDRNNEDLEDRYSWDRNENDRKDRSYEREQNRHNREHSDRNKDSHSIDRARIFQINDDLDAIVLDVSDVDNILKLLNNRNNFDTSNSVRDYIRGLAPVSNQMPKPYKHKPRWVSPKFPGYSKVLPDENRRRSGQRGGDRFGLPFELNVQGLGQVNQ